jgi:hypothetical protein
MRSWLFTTSIVAALSLISAPSAAAQASSQAGKGPLALAIDRSIDRLSTTRAASGGVPATGWDAVTTLRGGTEVLLRTNGGIDGRRAFVFADVAELVVLNLSHPALTHAARERLRDIGVDQPVALLAARQHTIVSDRTISVGAGVISESGRALAPLGEVVQTIPRSAVREIRLERTGGSKVGAAVGATAGIVAGLLTAPYWMMKPCNGSCGDEQLMLGVSLVGLPVAGALVGYLPRGEEVVVYRSNP